MENKLNNLKDKMNKTVFKDVNFNENLQNRVLNSIETTKSQNHLPLFKKRFNAFLSGTVLTMFFAGITYYVGTQLHIFNEAKENNASETMEPIKETKNETTKNETIYAPPKQEENYTDMTKEEILEKMLNTVDYFETAKGEFISHYANIPSDTKIEYELSLNNKAGGYSKSTQIDKGKETVTYHYYKDGFMWDIDE